MLVNQINLTSELSIPKGNFDFIIEATHNEQLYLGCLNAEKELMMNYDECLINLRKALEMLGIELEKWYRAEKNGGSSADALRSIFIDLKKSKSHGDERKERRSVSKKNFYIRHVVDFEKKDHEDFTKQNIKEFIEDYVSCYPYEYPDEKKRINSLKSIAYDLYNRCSRPLKEKGSGTKTDCVNLVRLFHRLLCMLNYVQEPYDFDLTPMGDYYPIPFECYDQLSFVRGNNMKMYVSEDGGSYYMFKRKDTEYLEILDQVVYKDRLAALERMDGEWKILDTVTGYGDHAVSEIGTRDYRRRVYPFMGRPRALTHSFLKKLAHEGLREEAVRSILRLFAALHRAQSTIAHTRLTPECIYICMNSGIPMPYVVDFENERVLNSNNGILSKGMLDDYFDSMDLQKFLAPEVRNSPSLRPWNTEAADVYSLGKIIRYIYEEDEKKVASYVEKLTVKDPDERPGVFEAARTFSDEVVSFEPTVTIGLDILIDLRLLVFSMFKGFEDYYINDSITIGRMYSSNGSDIKLDSPIASRTHGRFLKTDHGFEYIDMLSTNGTFINGILYGAQRNGRTDPKPLKAGDILKIDHPEFKKPHRNAIYMFVLNPSDHEMSQHEIEIYEGMDILIGRDRGDICLTNNRVSKRHGRFVVKKGVLFIQDLNSTNGIFLNGKRVNKPTALKETDCVRIEDYIFIYVEGKIYYYSE